MSTKTLAEWSAITPKSTVRFRDIASVRDSLAHGEGAAGLEFEVASTTVATEANSLATFVLLRLKGKRQEALLFITAVDANIQAELYSPVSADLFEPGTRAQMLDPRGRPASQDWIFSPPADVENFQIGNLSYTKEIDGGGTAYIQTSFGELQCPSVKENPVRSGVGPLLLSLSKYAASTLTDKNQPNLFLISEIGAQTNSDGGYLELFSGRTLSTAEIEVLAL